MQIRLSPDLDGCSRSAPAPMTVDELLARFPEVPGDLRDEPVLSEYSQAFGPLLRVARKPTAEAAARQLITENGGSLDALRW